jgi:hypothetical protein
MNVRIIDASRKYLQSARPWQRGSAVDDFADLDGDDAAAPASDDGADLDPDPADSSADHPATGGEDEGASPRG